MHHEAVREDGVFEFLRRQQQVERDLVKSESHKTRIEATSIPRHHGIGLKVRLPFDLQYRPKPVHINSNSRHYYFMHHAAQPIITIRALKSTGIPTTASFIAVYILTALNEPTIDFRPLENTRSCGAAAWLAMIKSIKLTRIALGGTLLSVFQMCSLHPMQNRF